MTSDPFDGDDPEFVRVRRTNVVHAVRHHGRGDRLVGDEPEVQAMMNLALMPVTFRCGATVNMNRRGLHDNADGTFCFADADLRRGCWRATPAEWRHRLFEHDYPSREEDGL